MYLPHNAVLHEDVRLDSGSVVQWADLQLDIKFII